MMRLMPMIAIPLIRKSFGRVAGYNMKNMREKGGRLIFSNVASTDAFQIEREFDAVAALKPKVKRCAVHLIVALHPDDVDAATDLKFIKWMSQIRNLLGFQDAQTVAWRHCDKKHPHIHVLLNRVPLAGRAVSIWGKRRMLRELCAKFDKEEGLTPITKFEFDAEHNDSAAQPIDEKNPEEPPMSHLSGKQNKISATRPQREKGPSV